MMHVSVSAELLRWAWQRARFDPLEIEDRFPQYADWERGEKQPTLKPPEERVPIPDLRTMADTETGPPSPDLLDTLYLCQQLIEEEFKQLMFDVKDIQ